MKEEMQNILILGFLDHLLPIYPDNPDKNSTSSKYPDLPVRILTSGHPAFNAWPIFENGVNFEKKQSRSRDIQRYVQHGKNGSYMTYRPQRVRQECRNSYFGRFSGF